MSFVADGYICLPGIRFNVLEVSAKVTRFCVGCVCCRVLLILGVVDSLSSCVGCFLFCDEFEIFWIGGMVDVLIFGIGIWRLVIYRGISVVGKCVLGIFSVVFFVLVVLDAI